MTNSIPALLAALALVESSGNDRAFNPRELALGRYQIRPAYFQDSKIKGVHSQCTNKEFSEQVILAYGMLYEPVAVKTLNYEVIARLHNGGPNWRKHKKATNNYWNKVKTYLYGTAK